MPVTLLHSIRVEAGGEQRTLVFAAGLGALANVLLLAIINAYARASAERDARMLILFLLLVGLHALCTRHVKYRLIALIQSVLYRIRVRVGERVARAELAVIERIKVAELCDLVTDNIALVSDRSGYIAVLLQSSVVMAFAVLYIAWLSLPGFVLFAFIVLVMTALFLSMRQDWILLQKQVGRIRVGFVERLMDLLAGFKELQFSRRRGQEVRADAIAVSETLRDAGIRSNNVLNDGLLIGEGMLFVLAVAVVYTLQGSATVDPWTISRLFAAVMFMWAPLLGVVSGIMPYIRANVALAQLARLEHRLAVAVRDVPVVRDDPWHGRATRLVAAGLTYRYPAEEDGGAPFRVGPVDLEVAAGEVVFIVGGNGSGKSTLVKLLTGLYTPEAGALVLDGLRVDADNITAFRDKISAIFSDFHLFHRLFGLAVRDELAAQMLEQMQLSGKVAVVDGAFTTLALSTGQRKRLAMVIALLDDRPIYMFDEWAADQDPEFRKYFYEELLPLLRSRGKLVLVVSHDDRFFTYADTVVTLEYGQVQAVARQTPPGAGS